VQDLLFAVAVAVAVFLGGLAAYRWGTKPCRNCGQRLRRSADVCVNCGRRQRRKVYAETTRGDGKPPR